MVPISFRFLPLILLVLSKFNRVSFTKLDEYPIWLLSTKMNHSSDLFLNAAKLFPFHVSEADKQSNEKLLGSTMKEPRW